MVAGESVCFCDFSLPRLAAIQRSAFCQEFWPSGSVYGSIHTSTAKQALIGSINNGIGIMLCCNVS
jgi:hypothetical protein